MRHENVMIEESGTVKHVQTDGKSTVGSDEIHRL